MSMFEKPGFDDPFFGALPSSVTHIHRHHHHPSGAEELQEKLLNQPKQTKVLSQQQQTRPDSIAAQPQVVRGGMTLKEHIKEGMRSEPMSSPADTLPSSSSPTSSSFGWRRSSLDDTSSFRKGLDSPLSPSLDTPTLDTPTSTSPTSGLGEKLKEGIDSIKEVFMPEKKAGWSQRRTSATEDTVIDTRSNVNPTVNPSVLDKLRMETERLRSSKEE